MKRKRKAAPKAAPAPILPQPAAVVAPDHEAIWRAVFTDREGEFDTGRVLVAVVVLTMCGIAAFHGDKFDPQGFGVGIGSVLGGFAAYLWGDTRRPPPSPPTTTTTVQQTQVTTP